MPKDEVEILRKKIARLERELERYRRNTRPKSGKRDDSGPLPLWERIGPDGKIVPTVPILEMHPWAE